MIKIGDIIKGTIDNEYYLVYRIEPFYDDAANNIRIHIRKISGFIDTIRYIYPIVLIDFFEKVGNIYD